MEEETKLKTNGVSKEFNIQTNNDVFNEGIPTKFKKSIHPVLVINPLPNQICNIALASNATNSTSTTIYTTPKDTDFYLTFIQLSVIKDATSTSTAEYLTAIVNGSTISLLHMVSLTLTAQSGMVSGILNPPLKIDRNTAIAITNSTNVANVTTRGSIVGFTYDPTFYNLG